MNVDNKARVPLLYEKYIGTPTPTRPIGYTETGEPVWPITSDPMQDCDHVFGWVCNELGEHTDTPYMQVAHLLRLVYAQLEASEAKYANSETDYYATLPLRRLRADLYVALSMADSEATDPCINCDHPVRAHDEAFPAPCMSTGCKCGSYCPSVNDDGSCTYCTDRDDGPCIH